MPRETPYSSPFVYLPLHPLSFDNAGQFGNFEPQNRLGSLLGSHKRVSADAVPPILTI